MATVLVITKVAVEASCHHILKLLTQSKPDWNSYAFVSLITAHAITVASILLK